MMNFALNCGARTRCVTRTMGSSVWGMAARGVSTKACVLGAAGGIGQPLSLLLKLDKNIDELSLYDVAPVVPGVAADISHINTPGKLVMYKFGIGP